MWPSWLRWENLAGVVVVPHDVVEMCRERVLMRCSSVPVKGKRKAAKRLIEAAAREAIVEIFEECNPGRRYRVTSSWPDAWCALHLNGDVSMEIFIGYDYSEDADGIEPLRFRANWDRAVATERKPAIAPPPEPVRAAAPPPRAVVPTPPPPPQPQPVRRPLEPAVATGSRMRDQVRSRMKR